MSIELNQKAPDFTLQNTQKEPVKLSDYEGKKNIVLLFFPLAFTSVCTAELCNARDNMKDYESLDAEVLGVSVDSMFTLKIIKKSQNLNFQLLSDFNKEVAKEYGVLYEEFFGMHGVSKRSAFVIDKEGVIKYAEVLEDAGNQPDFNAIQETLAKM